MSRKKFNDTRIKFDESILCTNWYEAKSLLKYWDGYNKAIKENNPNGEFPAQYVPALVHLNSIANKKPWYIGCTISLAIGIVIGLTVNYLTVLIGIGR